MRRRVSRRSKASHAPARPREPLAEGIVPLKKNGHRAWASMSDGELVAFTQEYIKNHRISGRMELLKADKGLYHALRRRKLLDKIGLELKIQKARPWKDMSDEGLVTYAQKFMEERGISSKGELQKTDEGLYAILLRRDLLDNVGFEEERRLWYRMSHEGLVALARGFIRENGITGKSELYRADKGLYDALRRRKLLERVDFEERYRDWTSMSDGELVSHAKMFMKKKGISGRSELQETDLGLYKALHKRKLLDKAGFKEKLRRWRDMSGDELVAFAKEHVKKEGIRGRRDLYEKDSGLYSALHRRKLLDDAFADMEQTREKEEAQALFDGLMEFGGAE